MSNIAKAVENLRDLNRRMLNAAKIGEEEEEIVFSNGLRPFETLNRVFTGLAKEVEEIIDLLETHQKESRYWLTPLVDESFEDWLARLRQAVRNSAMMERTELIA